ncbi:Aste57867_11301 [Aphanomyces stellatus]|uniref:Aste57867_11301 protein n=1 Tax=Aphanomyces stellatus TaxID=120398 RepID=A0A485KT23_9STRA|nr:hypothetical protein As57867_011259 [Aphanomyces stellatus]VFT88163.1 Aste57867_11301 [Aphanomyces stellatus]
MGCTQSSAVQRYSFVLCASRQTDCGCSIEGYLITDSSVDEHGVVFYHIDMNGVVVKKRFRDFKSFHKSLVRAGADVPPLPSAGVASFVHPHRATMVQERCIRFQRLLNAAPQEYVNQFLGVWSLRPVAPPSTTTPTS